MSQEKREEVLKLMKEKDKIEDEIKQLMDILGQNGVGMNDPLIDAEGFPISSIDVYQVRHARHRIICLQNDHKAIMKKIECGLHGYYSCNADKNTSPQTPMEVDRTEAIVYKIPFAKINLLSSESPAELCGLLVDDEIVEFGSVNANNFQSINDIASVVQHSEGKPVNVKVKRGEGYSKVYLVPKKWKGKGLLGCNIVSI